MIRLAIFGRPVSHSLSPRVHGLFAAQCGLAVDYRPIDTGPGELAGALAAFAAEGGTGCNVTLPLKREAMSLAAHCSDRVTRAGAANTLWMEERGWSAENTDGIGLVDDLRRLGLDPGGRRVALLGAGGAAAGVTAPLLAAGPAVLHILNRSADKAEALAASHADLGPVSGHALESLGDRDVTGPGYDLVLNATSLGQAGDIPPLTAAMFRDEGFLYDLNYGQAATPLSRWANETGIPYSAGIGMLVGQAAAAFRLWTGETPDVEGVIEELVA